jgi:hypothetical protein
VFAKPDEIDPPAGAGLSLLSRTGPEVPPDVARVPLPDPVPAPQPEDSATAQSDRAAPAAAQSCLVESTETLPIIAATPRQPPPATVAARAVIVYETSPRRPWRLWAFTAVLVALTIGVVLGQAVAWQPVSRTASAAEAQVVPTPSASLSMVPTPTQQVTAPLGSIRTRLLEVTSTATVVHIRSMNLGTTLFQATAFDSSAVPSRSDNAARTRLDLTRTGAPGTAGLDIQLNSRVSWTIRLTGGTTEQDVDMRAGGLAGLQLTGGNSLMVLRLPKPEGTVPLYIGGTVGRLSLATDTGTMVRLRLAKPAGVVTVDEAKQRTPVTPAGWASAQNRYDLSSYATIASLAVTHR